MATANDVLNVARSQLGYVESPPRSNRTKYGQWYGMDGNPWCDMFVSWVAAHAGAGDIIGKFAYTPSHANWFKQRGQWHSSPQVGDIVFFDFPGGMSRIEHVGIVEEVGSGYILAIEGNTSLGDDRNGGCVMRRKRSGGIKGYGRPAYAASSAPATPPKGPRTKTGWMNAAHHPCSYGHNDATTAHFQDLTDSLEIDGEFGPATKAYVENLQRYVNAPVTGVLDDGVWALKHPTLKRGDKGFFVAEVQRSINGIVVDEDFGPATEKAVKEYQAANKLTADGVVGFWTWASLLT